MKNVTTVQHTYNETLAHRVNKRTPPCWGRMIISPDPDQNVHGVRPIARVMHMRRISNDSSPPWAQAPPATPFQPARTHLIHAANIQWYVKRYNLNPKVARRGEKKALASRALDASAFFPHGGATTNRDDVPGGGGVFDYAICAMFGQSYATFYYYLRLL